MHRNDLIGSYEAARILSIDRATFNRWAKRGLVPIALTAPGVTGPRLFLRSDIEALAVKRAKA